MAWQSELKRIFNKLLGIDPRKNADGTMTTKHGNKIVPYRIDIGRNGGFRTNVADFMYQPRVRELAGQMLPLLASAPDDKLILDPGTGDFYLKSDLDRNGVQGAKVLGQIDMTLEEPLFKMAMQLVGMKKLFGDASRDNPVVMDDSGRVYPKNNPDQTRGHVRLGPGFQR